MSFVIVFIIIYWKAKEILVSVSTGQNMVSDMPVHLLVQDGDKAHAKQEEVHGQRVGVG